MPFTVHQAEFFAAVFVVAFVVLNLLQSSRHQPKAEIVADADDEPLPDSLTKTGEFLDDYAQKVDDFLNDLEKEVNDLGHQVISHRHISNGAEQRTIWINLQDPRIPVRLGELPGVRAIGISINPPSKLYLYAGDRLDTIVVHFTKGDQNLVYSLEHYEFALLIIRNHIRELHAEVQRRIAAGLPVLEVLEDRQMQVIG